MGGNVIQMNGGIMINYDVREKSIMYLKKSCLDSCYMYLQKNGKYLACNMDDSAIICNEVIESSHGKIKTIPTNFIKKKATSKTQGFYILFAFLLITIALLITVSAYFYLIKY